MRSRLRSVSSTRVWLLTAGIAAVALVLTLGWVATLDRSDSPFSLPWPLLAGLFYLAEVRVVHVQSRREAHSFTLSDVPLVLGLFLVSPPELVLACVTGAGLGLLIHRRPQRIKLAFNVALFALQAGIAVTVFHALGAAGGPLVPQVWVATVCATLSANVIGLAAVAAVVSIVERRMPDLRSAQVARFGLIVGFTNTGLALTGVTLLSMDGGAPWLLAIPLLLLVLAYRSYRAYAAQRDQSESLELLFTATRILHRSTDLERAVVELLVHARDRFHAEFAELVLFPHGPAEEALRSVIGPEGTIEVLAATRLDSLADASRLAAIARREAFIVPPTDGRKDLPHGGERVAGRTLRDALVSPLIGEKALIGTILLADRMGEVGTFRADELRLFQTLANHAGVALENGRLGRSLQESTEQKDRMRYELEHDALTGLANRALFLERTGRAFRQHHEGGAPPAVLFVDLDDFKTVNDRLGHAAGDQVLRVVADRLRGCLRAGDLAARLGGDEFALLIPAAADAELPVRIAERIVAALGAVVRLPGGLLSTTHASVGVARAAPDRATVGELINDADVAMYTAKARGKGRFVLFEPSLHAAVLERRTLRIELEGAVERDELVLHYQPVRGLAEGELVGVEALLRWQHPERGLLEPRDFLALAEESGLIVPIGRWVLTTACRQARAWDAPAGGRGPIVSVNIAAAQLLRPSFPEEVAAVLRETGLPPERLQLEVGERLLMADTAYVVERLARLSAVGVRLAVDDFGTGFSSLSYLGQVPLHVIKIAKACVDTTDGRPDGSRITRAIVALAHSLRLSVIAEGIERPDQLAQLQVIGCDAGQGYFFARPADAAGITRLFGPPTTLLAGGVAGMQRRPAQAPAA